MMTGAIDVVGAAIGKAPEREAITDKRYTNRQDGSDRHLNQNGGRYTTE